MKIIQTNPIKTISKAVNKYLEFIAPTYGPAGKKILIALNEFNIKAVDDGFEASKEFELENEFENAVISYIKESTKKTNNRVGDGTTTAVILTAGIVNEVMKDFDDPLADTNYHAKAESIKQGTLEAIEQIKSKSKEVKTKQELFKIAYNSYNNKEIATLISDTVFKIGQDGILSVEDSNNVSTEVEIVKGLELQKGIISPYLINNDKEEGILNEPVIILINKRLEFFSEIVPIIKKVLDSGKKEIFFVADSFGDDVINNFIYGKLSGKLLALGIEIPGYGDKTEMLKDIASVVGATVIDPKTTKLEEVDAFMFGSAKKIVLEKSITKIIGAIGNVTERVSQLTTQLKDKVGHDKESLEKRIATLKGGIALIKVGANTENEQKAIKAKVEDAVNATKVAFKDGIVKGAGRTYTELKTSSEILNNALKAPIKQLQINGAQFLDENVTDPTGVLIAALETASSIACGLITIGGITAVKREKKDKLNEMDY